MIYASATVARENRSFGNGASGLHFTPSAVNGLAEENVVTGNGLNGLYISDASTLYRNNRSIANGNGQYSGYGTNGGGNQ